MAESRKTPKQERSKRRYEAIVRAAAESFATQGFDATTMEAIAHASGSAIGTVYRFFPNKRAVFSAVAAQGLVRARETFSKLVGGLAGGPELSWHELLDRSLDEFALLHETDPATRAMLANMQLYGEYAEADLEMVVEFGQVIEGLFAVWTPSLDQATRAVAARMVVMTSASMLVLASREPPEVAAAMIDQTKLMLRRYLEPWLELGS